MFVSMWQEVADVLEAVVLEKALQLRARYNSWLEVAKAIHAAAPSSWPKMLGDSAAFNVSLKIDTLNSRLKAKFPPQHSKAAIVERARKKAVAILARSQLYAPGPEMSLWNYCIPKQDARAHQHRQALLPGLERFRLPRSCNALARPGRTVKTILTAQALNSI